MLRVPKFENFMSQICELTGKRPMKGSIIWRSGKPKKQGGIGTHITAITKRRFMPNLQYRRFWVETENRWVRLRISSAALRLIDKKGIDVVLADLRARGQA